MLFCDPLKKKKMRSGITSCICDREAYNRSGKEIFDDFSHWTCCLNCYFCTEQGLSILTSLTIIEVE